MGHDKLHFSIWHVEETAYTRDQIMSLREADSEPMEAQVKPTEPPKQADDEEIDGKNWRDYANCKGVDPELMMPARGESVKPAKAVCESCVVVEPCLEEALLNQKLVGIRGNKSENERKKIRRERRLGKQAG